MKGKRLWTIVSLALTAVGCCALGACAGEQGAQGVQGEQGIQGEQGVQGEAGKSAYQIWLDNGYVGTEADFLAWLKEDLGDEAVEILRFQKISGKEEYRVMGMGTVSSLDIVIPATYRGWPVTEIGANAFTNECYIENCTIPDSVTSIGSSAFSNCESLTSVEIPDSVTSIGNSAFEYCRSLTSVVIGDSVTSIGEGAFYSCTSLTSVEIPDSVTSIGDSAFHLCCKLVEVVNKSPYITVGKGSSENGFVGNYALGVYNAGDAYESKLSNDNGYIIYTDENERILVGYAGNEIDLVLPSDITQIYQCAFYGCDSLTSVEIPDSVKSIGYSAFEYCRSLTSVEIPDGVTSIGDSTFFYCGSLTSVVIPDSVTGIGFYAFDCCASLTTVYYKGTAEEWKGIWIGGSNLTDKTRYYYDESESVANWWHYDKNGEIVHA